MQNQDQLGNDNGQHRSHWNEERVDGNVPSLCPADNWWKPGINGAVPSQAKSQHRRYYERHNPDKDRYRVKKVLPLFLLFQLVEVEWRTDGKEGIANLYGNPNRQWVDNKT